MLELLGSLLLFLPISGYHKLINGFEYNFTAEICIELVINLPEVIPVDNKKSRTVVEAFEDG